MADPLHAKNERVCMGTNPTGLIWCTRQPRGIIPTFASVLLARVELPGLRHSTRSTNDLAPIFFMAWRTFKHSQGQNQRQSVRLHQVCFNLDRRYLRAPRLRVPVDHVLDLQIDARGVRKKLIEAESSDNITHSSLADLIDRIVDVLNHDHCFFRAGNMIVSDCRDVDRDVILGDDFLRGDLHRDGAQRYAHHLLDGNEDEREPRPAHALEFAEKKYDAALVLPQHAKRADEIEDYCNAENVGPVHGGSIW